MMKPILASILICLPRIAAAHASSETIDKIADWLAIFVICVAPVAAVAILLMIHVLPEKIAEKRHHPQKDAIQMLCFLSLVFGGLLWPLAWLWTYIKPLGYRMAYGTDKHDDFFLEAREKARRGELPSDELGYILGELDGIAARRILPPELQRVRDELQVLQASAPPPRHHEGARGGERKGDA
jgi:CBS domain containing-hemolysin-like protein